MTGDELEDLCGQAAQRLLEAVERARSTGEPHPVSHPARYATVVADSVFSDHLRRARPNWWRLKRRILYLLDGHAGGGGLFARWRLRVEWLGGLARWRGRPFRPGARYGAFCEDPGLFCREFLGARDPERIPLPELLAHLFRWLGTPLEVDGLTSHVATLQRVTDAAVLSLEGMAGGADQGSKRDSDSLLPPSGEDVGAQVLAALGAEERRADLWRQVGGLPPRQRAALLLGMDRDDLLLLADTGTAVAEALAMPLAQFVDIWRVLPLPDRQIAGLLEATPQQVSNLRKCARERLARWLARSETEGDAAG